MIIIIITILTIKVNSRESKEILVMIFYEMGNQISLKTDPIDLVLCIFILIG